MDDADWANDMAERERAALIARARRLAAARPDRRVPPPDAAPQPARLDGVLDDAEGRA